MKIIFCNICLVVTLNFSAFSSADPTTEVSDYLSRYRSLVGNFDQTLVDANGEAIQSSSGNFVIQRPGLFRWETLDPFPQLLISNLETLWLYDPDLEQVTIRPFSRQVSQSPALLLSGNAEDIANHYYVTTLEPQQRYQLVPKEESTFTKMELVFTQAVLQEILVVDSLEQTTTFAFSDIKTNQEFDNSLFFFDVPDGVDVLIDE